MKNQHQENSLEILAKEIQISSDKLDANIDIDLSPKTVERIRLINALVVQIFLDPKDIDTHNLLPFIRYLIGKFGLSGYVSEVDILIEAYTIAIQNTKTGKKTKTGEEYVIRNLPAWFKGTALNIIKNLKAELKKQDLIKSELKYNQRNHENLSFGDEPNDKTQSILQAFTDLKEADQYLLNLRTVKGFTWLDIAETMIKEGKEPTPTSMDQLLARLRKRHNRALNRLRKRHEDCNQLGSNISDR